MKLLQIFFNLDQSTNSISEPLHGKGAFFYIEPVTIHSSNALLERPPQGIPLEVRREICIITYVNHMGQIIVTDDGFVGLFLREEQDQQAIEFLNTIFASARLLWGIEGYIVRLWERCNFEWIPNSRYISITSRAIVERNIFSLQRDGDDQAFENWKTIPRRLITPTMMEQTIQFADDVLSNQDIHMDLILLFDGFTLYYKGAYTAAYLYGWMMIETFVGKIWDNYIESINRSRKDKDTLKDNNRWTTYHHIEMLSMVNKMNDGARDLLHKLRRKRNSIVHDRREVNETDASNCLFIADRILRNRFNNPDTPFVNIREE